MHDELAPKIVDMVREGVKQEIRQIMQPVRDDVIMLNNSVRATLQFTNSEQQSDMQIDPNQNKRSHQDMAFQPSQDEEDAGEHGTHQAGEPLSTHSMNISEWPRGMPDQYWGVALSGLHRHSPSESSKSNPNPNPNPNPTPRQPLDTRDADTWVVGGSK